VLPELLYSEVIEVDERIAADGAVSQPLDLARGARSAAARLRPRAARGGDRADARLPPSGPRTPPGGHAARSIGFTQVSVSHEVSPLIKFVARGDTTVVDAYLSPVLRRYVDRVAAAMPGVRLQFMQSGGLTDAHASRARTRSCRDRPAASSAWRGSASVPATAT
jgi:5-oxoprolinase (ATP-hydrolysing)